MSSSIAGIQVPDSAMAREITELVRDTASPLLFHHSSRVFYFAALAGQRLGLRYDSELLYAGCMFHDMGLTHQHSSDCCRFEVDGANAARDFLQRHGVDERDVERVWTAIALHTTPGIPEHMHPLIALVTAGVERRTKPGFYRVLRRVANETMDSRTVPDATHKYLLKDVLYTQYFHTDGSAIHYNWWAVSWGYPGSQGCLGMRMDGSKFMWEWAGVGTPLLIHY